RDRKQPVARAQPEHEQRGPSLDVAQLDRIRQAQGPRDDPEPVEILDVVVGEGDPLERAAIDGVAMALDLTDPQIEIQLEVEVAGAQIQARVATVWGERASASRGLRMPSSQLAGAHFDHPWARVDLNLDRLVELGAWGLAVLVDQPACVGR